MTFAKNQPDKYCEFCGGKISRKITNWWFRSSCTKKECEVKRKEKAKLKAKMYVSKIPQKKQDNSSPKIIGELNGRHCINPFCNKQLRDPFKFRCPACFKLVSNAYFDFEPMKAYKHMHNGIRE